MRTTFQAPITAFSTQNRMNTLPAGQPRATTPSTVIAFRQTASATGSTQVRVGWSLRDDALPGVDALSGVGSSFEVDPSPGIGGVG